jgi:putative ABC transport system ATP-binding protein
VFDVSLPSDNPVLDARALRYPADGSVLQQANLAVGEGETVAVLGPAKAGKTALLHCLTGRITPSSGSIWANGKAFHLFSADQKRSFQRRNYGLVPQRTGFVPELTLDQNVALPLIFAGVAREEAVRRARTWLERFELGEHVGRRAGSLPEESLRRAALARGMVTDPLVLFADEPLAGLDGADVAAIARMLLSIARSHGTSVVFFTREEDLAGRFQRRVDMTKGRTPNQPVPTAPATARHAPKPTPIVPTVVARPSVIVTSPAEQPAPPTHPAQPAQPARPAHPTQQPQPATLFSPPREPRSRGGLPLGAPDYLGAGRAEANR